MPGVLCNGKPTDQPLFKEMQAYCEGFRYRLGGTAAARPITNNPYSDTAQGVEKNLWDNGWNDCHTLAGQTLTNDQTGCCDGAGVTVLA